MIWNSFQTSQAPESKRKTTNRAVNQRFLIFSIDLFIDNLPVFSFELFEDVINAGEDLFVDIHQHPNFAGSFDKNIIEDRLKTPAAPAPSQS